KDIDVAAERGKERARGHAGDGEVDRAAPGVDASNAAADPVGQGVGRPEVVVADVEVEAAAGGIDVGHGIADVDGGQLKVAGREMLGAGVELFAAEGCRNRGEDRQGCVGLVRIGDVALGAGDDDPTGEGAAPANLDAVAKRFGGTGFADDGEIEGVAIVLHPGAELFGAVDGVGFLVIGDGVLDGAGVGRDGGTGGDEGGDAGLHVGGTTAKNP